MKINKMVATANASGNLNWSYKDWTSRGSVNVFPGILPETTATAPNSPIARAVANTIPVS
ncbi:hypothetical protein [Lentilactobacillus hilgardii]|uniref:hypothetical protein n=2 Tax=Lentilactobacillus hilgardii TaxID=1588 RepID=UPI001CDBD861|nr:hypothetical protein [Lentilactobacillus hilgardii]